MAEFLGDVADDERQLTLEMSLLCVKMVKISLMWLVGVRLAIMLRPKQFEGLELCPRCRSSCQGTIKL